MTDEHSSNGHGATALDQPTNPADVDATWAEPARNYRQALALLGQPMTDQCLPGEEDECGASNIKHAASFIGMIAAVTENRVAMFGPEMAADLQLGYKWAGGGIDTPDPGDEKL